MNDRLIDILTAAANKTTGTIYLTLTVATQDWDISTANNECQPARYTAKIDRNNIKHSIKCEVDFLSALLPKAHCYNN
jgi:hypothetical protein